MKSIRPDVENMFGIPFGNVRLGKNDAGLGISKHFAIKTSGFRNVKQV